MRFVGFIYFSGSNGVLTALKLGPQYVLESAYLPLTREENRLTLSAFDPGLRKPLQERKWLRA